MILFSKAYDGMDRQILRSDLLGLPFGQHLRATMKSLEDSKDEGRQSAADEGVLLTDADVWFSKAAIEELRAIGQRCRTAVRVTSSDGRDPLAVYLPPHLANDFLCEGSCTPPEAGDMNGRQLDSTQPPVRVKGLLDLVTLERDILYARACGALANGVRIRNPRQIDIRGELHCGIGVEIDLNVIIDGEVTLGDGVRVGANCILVDAIIGAQSEVHPYSIVEKATIGADSFVGPYGRIRPGSVVADSVQIGNFVEIKNSDVGSGSRINHLSFVGDGTVGKNVTLGAGTITCNHNRVSRAHTRIEDGAYVGSGSELVAPLTIAKNSTVGAGSTITESTPPGMLTLARARQVTVPHWTPPTSNSTDE